MLILLPVAYAVGLGAVLWVARHAKHWYALAKGVLSSLFVAVSLLAYYSGGKKSPDAYEMLLIALALCAVGDVMLGIANRTKTVRARPFVAGTLSFLCAHVCFCALFLRLSPFRIFDLALPAVLVFALWRLERRGSIRLKKMRPLGYLYTALVGLMTSKAISVGVAAGLSSPLGALTVAGGVLFLFSDYVLMFLYFGVVRRRWLRTANLTTYYIGIFLLALSARWY